MARLSALGVDFEHWCFGCGNQNPIGLHLDFEVFEGRAEARFTGQRMHQGYDETIHGGVVTALLDETMGWAIFHSGVWAVTGKIAVTFRGPVRVGQPLRVSGEIVRDRGRAIEARGALRHETTGEVLAEAEALFLRMPEARRDELERRYATTSDTFARVRAAVAAERHDGRER